MKQNIRILGIDDAPFDRFRQKTSLLIFTLMRLDFTVEGFERKEVVIDGTDSTLAIEEVMSQGIGKNADLVMADGITFCGFNICDFRDVNDRTGTPVISVTRREPDITSMMRAIEKHHPNRRLALEILERSSVSRLDLSAKKTVYVNVFGIGLQEAKRVIVNATKTGIMPEPVRLSHLIGTGLFKSRTN